MFRIKVRKSKQIQRMLKIILNQKVVLNPQAAGPLVVAPPVVVLVLVVADLLEDLVLPVVRVLIP